MFRKLFLTISLLIPVIELHANIEEVEAVVVTDAQLKVRFPSRSLINKYGKDMKQMLKMKYWSQVGARAVAGTAILGFAYSYIKGVTVVSADQIHESNRIAAIVQCEVEKALQSGNYPKISSNSWFDTIVNGGKALGLYMLFGVFNSTMTKLLDEPSVQWFVLKHTGLEGIHKEIIGLKVDMELLQKNQKRLVDSKRIEHYMGHVLDVYGSLVADVEKIVAYICHSTHQLKLLHDSNGLDDKLFDRLKSISEGLHIIVEQYMHTDDDAERIALIITIFNIVEFIDAEVRSSLQAFARVEKNSKNS